MSDTRLADLGVETFLSRLSSRDPVPGGGSAAAIAGAMGAALLHMVVELTMGRPAVQTDDSVLTEIGGAATGWQSELLRLAEVDAAAYAAVVRARRLPRSTDLEIQARTTQMAAAVREATRTPLEVTRRASEVFALAERLAPIGHRNAISDVGVAALLVVAAMRGAAMNVAINLPALPDDDPLRDEAAAEVERLLEGLDEREAAVRAAVEARLG